MWPANLGLSVSRESMDKLKVYHAMLLKWQRAINIVSPKTLDEAWVRHFADSAQVAKYVSRESMIVVDLGSGGGFPGMVLAILKPDLDVHFIESDERKVQFIKNVSRETKVPITAHVQRIEQPIYGFVPDLVSARALADLETLFGFVIKWTEQNPELECLFMKGARYQEEIEQAQKTYQFDIDIHESVTDPAGRILHIKNLQKK